MLTLGVISDTHVPDKARVLDPRVLEIFRAAHVCAILHAGDITTPIVLEMLAKVAPVHAVRGNRDWVCLGHLPATLQLEFGGVRVGLAHGHGNWWSYLADKPIYLVKGYELKRFFPRLVRSFPTAQVLVFGHTHCRVNEWADGRLVFNPGSASCAGENSPPGVGLLHIDQAGGVQGEIVSLNNM